mgnify:CR=1 FL=1
MSRRDPHTQKLRKVAVTVTRRPESVQIPTLEPTQKTKQRQEKPQKEIPFDPKIEFLLKLARAERKHMIETVQKMVFETDEEVEITVVQDPISMEVSTEKEEKVQLPDFEGRTTEDKNEVLERRKKSFLYDS